ncbi:MAG: molybdate ABC transporter permease subunit [Acidobacteriota bacterium]|nr:molybdate ABC transporter permease subunit [Acidobacteriota bacterium]
MDLTGVLLFTLAVAAASTAWILVPGVLLAWLLSRPRLRGRSVLETLVTLPLVLPPTAVGLVLLALLGRGGPVGGWLYRSFGLEVAFTGLAVVLAGGVMALPLLVRTARGALEEVDPRLLAVARTLGRGPAATFFEVQLPLAWRGILGGVVLAFGRALGEFGATIVVAGNIPGRTQTLALALFQQVQIGDDRRALLLAGLAAVLAFAVLLLSQWLVGRGERALGRRL